MKIHEYQAKELFRKFDVPVPEGSPAFTVDEAVDTAGKLGGFPVVVKAQIHAGGRGKGGEIIIAASRLRKSLPQKLGPGLLPLVRQYAESLRA